MHSSSLQTRMSREFRVMRDRRQQSRTGGNVRDREDIFDPGGLDGGNDAAAVERA